MRRPDVEVGTLAYILHTTVKPRVDYCSLYLEYFRDDPYAVRFVFQRARATQVNWTFSRELVARGLTEPSGLGDVRVFPAAGADPGYTAVSFTSDEGLSAFKVPSGALGSFLTRTYRLVPQGREGDWIDWDATVARLLEKGRTS